MPKVKFIKERIEIEVPVGANLRKEAIKAGVSLYAGPDKLLNCRGLGLCGTCHIHLKKGTIQNTGPLTRLGRCSVIEKFRTGMGFYDIGHEDEIRLACQTTVLGDLEVETTPAFNWFGTPAGK
ncbi:MAG: (2Fe-2S)-binding protein [Planctomycetes bacterium]|nr:(2Fe-2S)-binding protein [Planctomycetota bacterium]